MTYTVPDPILPTWNELRLLWPELALVLGMCAVVIVPLLGKRDWVWPTAIAFITLAVALIGAVQSLFIQGAEGGWELTGRMVFYGSVAVDPFSQCFKVLLLLFSMLVLVQWMILSRRQTSDAVVPDFHCLLLGAVLGMSLMASANNLLTVFVAIEAASLPSFVLAGYRKHTRMGAETALKFVIFGAASSAVMVYGMSLVYGAAGTLALPAIAAVASEGAVPGSEGAVFSPMLAVGLVAMFAGFAFKLSAVPLHFWCPDVFEGAPYEVTTFLSVASKAAAVALVLRLLDGFGAVTDVFGQAPFTGIAFSVAALGAVTATWGNLVALHQNSLKRLLAYSSIAHAGYMIMAVAVGGVAAGDGVPGALLFYILVYVFMNTGAFTVAALIAQRTGSDDIRDHAGLVQQYPGLTVLMAVFLLSLFGLPGLGGFLGKVYIGLEMLRIDPVVGYVLVAVLLLNTLLSLGFYLRPLRHMVLGNPTAPPPEADAAAADEAEPMPGYRAGMALCIICAIGLLWTGLDLGASQAVKPYGSLMNRQIVEIEFTSPEPMPPAIHAEPREDIIPIPLRDAPEGETVQPQGEVHPEQGADEQTERVEQPGEARP